MGLAPCLNAPTGAWCSLTLVVSPSTWAGRCLNAPTGAWCSLTSCSHTLTGKPQVSMHLQVRGAPGLFIGWLLGRISALSQCTYRCVVLPDSMRCRCRAASTRLNAPTGAWCSLTAIVLLVAVLRSASQCTYRCVVLPDPCPRERRYDATSRARSATGPGSTPPDRPAPGPE